MTTLNGLPLVFSDKPLPALGFSFVLHDPFDAKVFVDQLLCERPFLRWAKTHRKSRINKKWRKKYGAIYAPCLGKGYQFGTDFVMCPCVKAALDNETKSR